MYVYMLPGFCTNFFFVAVNTLEHSADFNGYAFVASAAANIPKLLTKINNGYRGSDPNKFLIWKGSWKKKSVKK